MKQLTENKKILIYIGVFLVVLFLYKSFFEPEVALISDELSASHIGNDLLKMHEDLKKITFDQSLFSSQGYLGLVDFNISIPEQATGRTNPFDIIGRD